MFFTVVGLDGTDEDAQEKFTQAVDISGAGRTSLTVKDVPRYIEKLILRGLAFSSADDKDGCTRSTHDFGSMDIDIQNPLKKSGTFIPFDDSDPCDTRFKFKRTDDTTAKDESYTVTKVLKGTETLAATKVQICDEDGDSSGANGCLLYTSPSPRDG